MKRFVFVLLPLLLLPAWAQFGEPDLFGGADGVVALPEEPATSVELISSTASIQPGHAFDVGIRLEMDEHWHTYWKSGGDTDAPTIVTWELPPGFVAGEIQWPTPIRFLLAVEDESFVGYGYEKEAVLVVRITPPAALEDTEIELKAHVEWLECDDESCVPGDGPVALTLPVIGRTPKPGKGAAAIAASRKHFPVAAEAWEYASRREGDKVVLAFTPPADFAGFPADQPPTFFPTVPELIDLGHLGEFKATSGGFELVFPANKYAPDDIPESIPGILTGRDRQRLPGGLSALEFVAPRENAKGTGSAPPTAVPPAAAPPGAVPPAAAPPGAVPPAAAPPGAVPGPKTVLPAPADTELLIDDPEGGKSISLGLAALFFVLGGMILNLMPCIFPVLAMKVMSFVKQAQSDTTKAWKHGIVFGVGVLVSMWVIVLILLVVRGLFPNEDQTWSILQNPYLAVGLTLLFLVLSINLFGVFEMGLSLTRVGTGEVGHLEGYTGSFFSGVLATVVATPCTGPFLGAPIAYALTQPAPVMFFLFSLFALGIALPYILLSAFPPLLRVLPKPGPWMKTFKIIMGFIMLLVTAAAAWVVLNLISGQYAALKLGVGLVLTAFGWWIYGLNTKTMGHWKKMLFGLTLAMLFTGGAYALQFSGKPEPEVVAGDPGGKTTTVEVTNVDGNNLTVSWEPWSQPAVNAALAAGRPVFIDYTAVWCAICQANKPTMHSQEISKLLVAKDVAVFRADFTKKSPEIAAELKKLGRAGVPAYPLYSPGGKKVQLLPSALFKNKGKLIEALEALPDAKAKG